MPAETINLTSTSLNPTQQSPALASTLVTNASDPYGLAAPSANPASSFIQPLAAGNLQVITPNVEILSDRMVFSTVNEEVRAPKTLTLQNTGDAPLTINGLSIGNSIIEQVNAVRIPDYQRAADFSILNAPGQPFNLDPGATINLAVQFAPKRPAEISTTPTTYTYNGENYALLSINSSDPDQPVTNIYLAGLNSANYEGNNEPSIAEIARTFGWTLNVGTEKHILGGGKKLFGDEVYSPYWERADSSKPVELWPLAVYSGRGDVNHESVRFEAKPGSGGKSGPLYELAGRNNDDNVPGSNDITGGENQKLLPKILINGVNSAPTTSAVSFVPNSPFALNRSRKLGVTDGAWTDDSKNGPQQLHNWRMYPVRDINGNIFPNTWFATSDPGNNPDPKTGKNFDYNDNVYLLRNARPQTGIDPSIPAAPPGAPGMVLEFNRSFSGTLKDKNGQSTGFNNTQFNKNDGYSPTKSYVPRLIDLIPGGSGTLKVTSTAGSNAGSDNTLVNGLYKVFNAGGGANISTRLLGPLNNINAGFQQAGIMLGSDQDNYIKAVAIAQRGGNLGIQLYSERRGVGTNVGPIVQIANPAALQSLDLMLLANPQTRTVQAAYRAVGAGSDTGMVTLPGVVQLQGGDIGRYFAGRSRAGIITSNKGASPFTVSFDRFAITA